MEGPLSALNGLENLAVLNLQGFACEKFDLKDLDLASLVFLNVSRLDLTEFVVGSKTNKLVEIVAHSNKLTDLRGFDKFGSLKLLDVENNSISDDFIP